MGDKLKILLTVSVPQKVLELAKKYFDNNDVKIYVSPVKNKKYRLFNPKGKAVDFGDIRYEDFTYHNDLKRKYDYLNRSKNIRGNWKNDKYSANNLSRAILWDANS
jgi:hypothetical protein